MPAVLPLEKPAPSPKKPLPEIPISTKNDLNGLLGGSDDEVLELGAVLVALPAQNVAEDSHHNVVDIVTGVLDHAVNQQELNSHVFEAVGGQKEGNSVPLHDISDLDRRLVGLAPVQPLLSLLKQGQNIHQNVEILALRLVQRYLLELLEFLVDLGFDEVEDFSSAVVLSGNGVELVEGADG